MKALDVTCPTCGALPGMECQKFLRAARRFRNARITVAVKATRDANRVRREAAKL